MYTLKQVTQTGKPYVTEKKFPMLDDPYHFYVPEFLCSEFGIENAEPDAFNFESHNGRKWYYPLYNVKGKIPYFDYKEAKKNGFWIGVDAEHIMCVDFSLSKIGYTIQYSDDETNEEYFLILYDISQTQEYKTYSLQEPFLPKEDRI